MTAKVLIQGHDRGNACPFSSRFEQPGRDPLLFQQSRRLSVKRDKGVATEPSTVESNHTAGEVSTGVQNRQTRLDHRSRCNHIAHIEDTADDVGQIRLFEAIGSIKHPGEFTEDM